MNLRYVLLLLSIAFFSSSCSNSSDDNTPQLVDPKPTPLVWKKPETFPEPVYNITLNPLTKEGVELGRYLFYDGILSRTNQIGCGTCHQPQAAFTHHGHDISHGVDDKLGTRNSPSIQNMGWNTSFFWDGGVHNMDLVPFVPIENPVEMDESMPNILDKLRKSATSTKKNAVNYPKMFKEAFGTDEINSERFVKALSQFMMTLVSANSKYDYYKSGDKNAMNSLELEGMTVFTKNCSTCHQGELFTDHSFRNNGLYPLSRNDTGRFGITGQEKDLYKFKVPSLRNVAYTAPYMHDGRYKTLDEVLEHYTNNVQNLATLDDLLKKENGKTGIALTKQESVALKAFLESLSDEQFKDPGIGNAL
mgnify:CR=1 FL=1